MHNNYSNTKCMSNDIIALNVSYQDLLTPQQALENVSNVDAKCKLFLKKSKLCGVIFDLFDFTRNDTVCVTSLHVKLILYYVF